MKISLRNIGKVKEAVVEINGITVIAGENNTGKSTVGKALFSVFNSLYNLQEKISNTRKNLMYSTIKSIFDNENDKFFLNASTVISEIISNKSGYLNVDESVQLKNLILNNLETTGWFEDEEDAEVKLTNAMVVSMIEKCNDLLNVSDDEIFKRVLQNQLVAEFNGQITNINAKNQGELDLSIKGKTINAIINDSKITQISSVNQLNTQVIYYDNPFVLDELYTQRRRGNYKSHNQFLKECLLYNKIEDIVEEVIQETIVDNKIETILSKLNGIVPGELKIVSPSKVVYTVESTDESLNISNLSTGLKAFMVIKTLLSKGYIEDNGTIILDEPEVHLHPKWQLIFAEIIVMLQKEFNLHVLLNTHSPYFLRAVQVYAGKHGIADRCKYYLAENEGDNSVIQDVSDEIGKIYKKLSLPLQELENSRYAND